MILHKDSHVDHVSATVLKLVLLKYADKGEFFIETFELPEGMTARCGLYGPTMGDAPISDEEVRMALRPGRSYNSRLITASRREVTKMTVIGGPHDNHACVLYTVHGGPPAPPEPDDPNNINPEQREKSIAFWKEHAISEFEGLD